MDRGTTTACSQDKVLPAFLAQGNLFSCSKLQDMGMRRDHRACNGARARLCLSHSSGRLEACRVHVTPATWPPSSDRLRISDNSLLTKSHCSFSVLVQPSSSWSTAAAPSLLFLRAAEGGSLTAVATRYGAASIALAEGRAGKCGNSTSAASFPGRRNGGGA